MEVNNMQEKLEQVTEAVLSMDVDDVKKAVTEALDAGIKPLDLIQDGLTPAVNKVGALFEKGECFLPELIGTAEAMKAGMAIVQPLLVAANQEQKKLGKIVIGTVCDDVHDIGKNIVAAMLSTHGFEVIDLGINVADDEFIKTVEKEQPDILGLSALLTTTMAHQQSVIEKLEALNLRSKVKVIIGGAAVTPEWTAKIGADDYAADVIEAVEKCKILTSA
jgi:5-methyltetrahydrofolate--homocysteine methyltransferase